MKTKINTPQTDEIASTGVTGNKPNSTGHRPLLTSSAPFSNGITRRHFLRGTAAAAAASLTLGELPSALAASRNKILPKPNQSGIEHIVVLMMENRSFDHF